MKDVKVSIVTVSFNAEKTIEETIKSVAKQTYKNIEYLIIDGASKDNTLKIVNKYKKYIDVIVSEKDKGLYDAMNKGARKASGDLVYFLNADDVLKDKEVISDVAKAYEKGLDFIYGQVEFFYPNTNTSRVISRDASIDGLKSGYMPPHQGTFASRKLLLANPFDTTYRSSADFDFFCRAIMGGAKSKKLNRVIATVQIGGVSSGKVSYRETEQVVKKYFGYSAFLALKLKHKIFYFGKKITEAAGLSIHKG